jgi:spermidine/putrescine transport system ATP-binding protein
MYSGRIEQVSRPEEIFLRPRTRFVAAFLGQTDIIPSQVNGNGLETPIGHLNLATPLPIGTHLDVALRPDHIALNPVIIAIAGFSPGSFWS